MKEFRNLVSSEDFSCEELLELMELGAEIYNNPEKFSEKCRGKVLASLFFEPSTRTRLSFEAAMLRLGGSCITVPDPKVSSATKGESLQDTIRTVGCYSDIIAMRHPHEGSAELAKEVTLVPFINAGDGGHQHPTQTLTDLLTISQYKKSLENMTIGLCGDLKFGRTVHSLVKTLSKFKGNKFIFISPVELVIPEYIKMYLNDHNVEFIEVRTIEEVMDKLLYGTNFKNGLINNTIYHILDFERHSSFQSALKEAALSNEFQVVMLSRDFNPILTVETRQKTTVADAIRLGKEKNVEKEGVYTFIDVNGVLTYWGPITVDGERYFLMIVDNEDNYSAGEITKLAEIIELAVKHVEYRVGYLGTGCQS